MLEIESILVCTGVYNPSRALNEKIENLDTQILAKLSIDTDGKRQDHKIDNNRKDDCEFLKPTIILNGILDAVEHIVKSL